MPAKRQARQWGTVEKLNSGRYRIRYTHNGRRYSPEVTFGNERDARTQLGIIRADLIRERLDPEATKRTTETLAQYADRWIDKRRNKKGEPLRIRTRAEYGRLLAGPLADLAAMRFAAITPDVVNAWEREQAKAGTVTQTARAYSLLKSVMADAVKDKRIASNPCDIRGLASAVTGKEVKPPTDLELDLIEQAISEKYKAAVAIAAWGPLRYGELTELRRKDVEVIRSTDPARPDEVLAIIIHVTRAVTHTPGVGYVVGKTKSAAGVRSVSMPPRTFGAILAHLAQHVERTDDEALLFPARDGETHLAESTFVKHYYPAREAAGRPDMPWHALRHHGGTKYAQTGATIKDLQARLGHSSVTAAMRYQHASAERDAELARRMG